MKVVGEMWRIVKSTDEVAKYSAIAETMEKEMEVGELSTPQKILKIKKICQQLSNLVCILPYSACLEKN